MVILHLFHYKSEKNACLFPNKNVTLQYNTKILYERLRQEVLDGKCPPLRRTLLHKKIIHGIVQQCQRHDKWRRRLSSIQDKKF